MTCFLRPCLVLGWLLGATALVHAQPPSAPWRQWEPGELWRVQVERPGDAAKGPLLFYFTVSGPIPFDGVPCWRLLINSSRESGLDCHADLLIDRSTGVVRRLRRLLSDGSSAVEPLDAAHYAEVLSGPLGVMPFEFIAAPVGAATTVVTQGIPVRASSRHEAALTRVTADLFPSGESGIRLEQTWAVGEKWWRTCERWVRGRCVLRARWVNPPPGATAAPPKRVRVQTAPADPMQALRADARLQARLTLVGDRFVFAKVLGAVQRATGVELTLGPSLWHHHPNLGTLQLRDCPAWTVLGLLARQDLSDGHWVSSGGGYRLEGKSRAERISPPPRAARPAPVVAEASNTFTVLVISLVNLALFVGVLLFRFRRRSRKAR